MHTQSHIGVLVLLPEHHNYCCFRSVTEQVRVMSKLSDSGEKDQKTTHHHAATENCKDMGINELTSYKKKNLKQKFNTFQA